MCSRLLNNCHGSGSTLGEQVVGHYIEDSEDINRRRSDHCQHHSIAEFELPGAQSKALQQQQNRHDCNPNAGQDKEPKSVLLAFLSVLLNALKLRLLVLIFEIFRFRFCVLVWLGDTGFCRGTDSLELRVPIDLGIILRRQRAYP